MLSSTVRRRDPGEELRIGARFEACLLPATHPLLLLHWFVCTSGIGTALVLAILTWRGLTRAPPTVPSAQPPITVLRPFDGLDPNDRANLAILLRSSWAGPCQVLLCTDERNHEGIAIAQEAILTAQAEGVSDLDAALCLSAQGEEPPSPNRKVWHLQRGLDLARHEILVQSDSSSRPDPAVIASAVGVLLADPTLAVSWVSYVVRPGPGIGTLLSRITLGGTGISFAVVDAVCLALGERPLLAGGLVAMRRSAVEDIGGFAPFGDFLAEDMAMARAFARKGWGVRRAPGQVQRCLDGEGLADHFARLRRWNTTMLVMGVTGRYQYPLAHCPLALAAITLPLAILGAPQDAVASSLLLAALLLVRILWSTWVLVWVNHQPTQPALLWAIPFNEGVMFVAWASALVNRTVRWRGRELRILPGGEVKPPGA